MPKRALRGDWGSPPEVCRAASAPTHDTAAKRDAVCRLAGWTWNGANGAAQVANRRL